MTIDARLERARLYRYERIGSTSERCRQLALAGAADGTAVLATSQSDGRGSNGRRWESPAGNLFLSVVLRPRRSAKDTGCYSILAGLALIDALLEFSPHSSALSLLWPNDIMLADRKIGGVLVETAARADGQISWLVVGFGANLMIAPSIPGRRTSCLADSGIVPPPPKTVARAVLAQLRKWREVETNEGFAAVRAAWLQRAHAIGTPLLIMNSNGSLKGKFGGIDVDGALLFATASGLTRCIAGTVCVADEVISCSS